MAQLRLAGIEELRSVQHCDQDFRHILQYPKQYSMSNTDFKYIYTFCNLVISMRD